MPRAYDCGPSSPFRRLTTAHEELATRIEGPELERALTAPSLARMEAKRGPDRNGGFEQRLRGTMEFAGAIGR